MSWILVSLLMFLASVVMYTLVRYAQKQGVTQTHISFGMFVIPTFIFLIFSLFGVPLTVTPVQMIELFFVALLFSWFGNYCSMRGIQASANAGYSLILSKSYVVMTSILSIWLFNSPLTLKSALAIGCIVGFSVLIMVKTKPKVALAEGDAPEAIPATTSKEKKPREWAWLVWSLGAFLCWGGLALASKALLIQGIGVIARLFYVHVFVSGLLVLEAKAAKQRFLPPGKYWPVLFVIGVCSVAFNGFMQWGYQVSPNPGYINAVNAASIALLTLVTAWLFKDELTPRKLLGVCGVTAGLALLFV